MGAGIETLDTLESSLGFIHSKLEEYAYEWPLSQVQTSLEGKYPDQDIPKHMAILMKAVGNDKTYGDAIRAINMIVNKQNLKDGDPATTWQFYGDPEKK